MNDANADADRSLNVHTTYENRNVHGLSAGDQRLDDRLALAAKDIANRPHVANHLHRQRVARNEVLRVTEEKGWNIHHGVMADHERGQVRHFHIEVVNVAHSALVEQNPVPHNTGICLLGTTKHLYLLRLCRC